MWLLKVLRGGKPATPVEQSTRYELVLNLRTAKALGITTGRVQRSCSPYGADMLGY